MRPDRVSIVRDQEPTIRAFAGEHVEVISPEINHDFLQLAFAVNCAQDARHLQFARQKLRRPQIVFHEVIAHGLAILRVVHRIRRDVVGLRVVLRRVIRFRRLRALHLAGHRFNGLRGVRVWRSVRSALHAISLRRSQIRRQVAALLQLLQQLSRLRILLVKLSIRHAQRPEVLQLCFAGRIIDLFWKELLRYVVVDAHRLYAFDIARPRAEAEPVQHVQDALVLAQLSCRFTGRCLHAPAHTLRADAGGEGAAEQGDD